LNDRILHFGWVVRNVRRQFSLKVLRVA
jgi:hypothetical protein